MKLGVIDVGGGYRGIYACGVLDYCMDQQIKFDLGIGVSAGSANLISYAANQVRRNYQFYTEYGMRKEYAGAKNFLKKGSYIDLDYCFGELSKAGGENPLDYPAVARNPMEFYVVATEAETGNTKYFSKEDIAQDDYDPLKASSSIPFINRPYVVNGTEYFDGALSDPVPVDKAFQLGCDKVVLLLTKPEDEIRNSHKDDKLAHMIHHHYPYAAQKLHQRAALYNWEVAMAKVYAKEGRVLIVAPDDTCGVSTLTRDKELLDQLYKKGYADGNKITEFLKQG